MRYAGASFQRGPNYPLPIPFEWYDTTVGIEGRTVMQAYEKFLQDFFRPISREVVPAVRFKRLKERWEEESAFLSSVSEIAMHPAYQQIIGMGTVAVPLILREIAAKPGQWFWALKSITGENPVPPGYRGNIKEMTKAWLKWGKERGYIY
jgi:hypothetical protein